MREAGRPPRKLRVTPALLAHTLWRTASGPLSGLRAAVDHLTGRRRLVVSPGTWTLPEVTPEASARARAAGQAHVVFVGPTIGEFRMMEAIAQRLAAVRPHASFTFCLKDPRSVETLRLASPELSLAFRPVEYLPVVARWLRRVRPDVLVFVEGSRFPTLAWGAHLAGARTAAVNGSYPRRKGALHRLRAPYFRWLFAPFDLFAIRSEADRPNLEAWTRSDATVVVAGDLKASLRSPTLPATTAEAMGRWLGAAEGPPLLAAGSTADREEEELVVRAFLQVREARPCRLLIAPRRLERLDETLAALSGAGLRVSRRSDPVEGAEAFLLDSLGELATAYRFSAAAYVGGAFRGEGHNVMEPIEWGVPVAYGPRRGRFELFQRLCEEAGVGARVSDAADLARFWSGLLENDDARREEARGRAARLMEAHDAPLARTVAALAELIDLLESRAEARRPQTGPDPA